VSSLSGSSGMACNRSMASLMYFMLKLFRDSEMYVGVQYIIFIYTSRYRDFGVQSSFRKALGNPSCAC
jgi:hypothetical protein